MRNPQLKEILDKFQGRKERGIYIDETNRVVKSDIKAFIHCKKCCEEKPSDVSPQEYNWTEVGKTETGFQVWCIRHNMEVGSFNVSEIATELASDFLDGYLDYRLEKLNNEKVSGSSCIDVVNTETYK